VSYVLDALYELSERTGGLPDEVFNRVVPAIKHPETGKLYIGKRGEIHANILDRHNLRKEYFDDLRKFPLPQKWDSEVHMGFYDHKDKKFYSRKDTGYLDATDIMTPHQRFRRLGSESLLEHMYQGDTKVLVPAFKHPQPGKLYIGRRGDTHNDIIDSHPDEIDPSHRDNPDPYEGGFYNHKNHTFINKADSGLDSADLMTKLQRMRKLGLEHLYTEYKVADDEESVWVGDNVKARLRPAIIHPATRGLG
jgi:hypothetical protein